jgi:hypothetical protein
MIGLSVVLAFVFGFGFSETVYCASLEGGFSLREAFLQQTASQKNGPKCSVLGLKHQDFVAELESGLRSLVDLCGLQVDEDRSFDAARRVVKERANAHRGQLELQAFSEQEAYHPRNFGY